jgi:hypothetical protein
LQQCAVPQEKKNDNYGKKTHNGAKHFLKSYLYIHLRKKTLSSLLKIRENKDSFVGKTCGELVHTVILEYFSIKE